MERVHLYLVEIFIKLVVGANNLSDNDGSTEIKRDCQPFRSNMPIRIFIDKKHVPLEKLYAMERILKLHLINTVISSVSTFSSHNEDEWTHAIAMFTGSMGNYKTETFSILHMENITYQITLHCSPRRYLASASLSEFDRMLQKRHNIDNLSTIDLSEEKMFYIEGMAYERQNFTKILSQSSNVTLNGSKPVAVIFDFSTHGKFIPLIEELKGLNIRVYKDMSKNPFYNNTVGIRAFFDIEISIDTEISCKFNNTILTIFISKFQPKAQISMEIFQSQINRHVML